MARYLYVGDDERYYPTLGLSAKPGGEYDLTAAPDDRFKRQTATNARRPAPDSPTTTETQE